MDKKIIIILILFIMINVGIAVYIIYKRSRKKVNFIYHNDDGTTNTISFPYNINNIYYTTDGIKYNCGNALKLPKGATKYTLDAAVGHYPTFITYSDNFKIVCNMKAIGTTTKQLADKQSCYNRWIKTEPGTNIINAIKSQYKNNDTVIIAFAVHQDGYDWSKKTSCPI